jgi:hypothetical protein
MHASSVDSCLCCLEAHSSSIAAAFDTVCPTIMASGLVRCLMCPQHLCKNLQAMLAMGVVMLFKLLVVVWRRSGHSVGLLLCHRTLRLHASTSFCMPVPAVFNVTADPCTVCTSAATSNPTGLIAVPLVCLMPQSDYQTFFAQLAAGTRLLLLHPFCSSYYSTVLGICTCGYVSCSALHLQSYTASISWSQGVLYVLCPRRVSHAHCSN